MIRPTVVAAATAIALLSANHTIAHAAASEGKKLQAHGAAHSASHHGSRPAHRRAMIHRSGRSAEDDGAPTFYGAPPAFPVYRWPGYTYVPRKGIVDEACNLPTSACPNEMRDIR
jgi:hypothetical protein